jgi:hypothetical protein
MPSSISSYTEFDALLRRAIERVDKLCGEMPEEQIILSIKNQLAAVCTWTRNGRKPAQGEKDMLNFGLIASRFLVYDDELCSDLFELASYITYWE